MSLTVTSVPGKQFATTEAATVPKMNQGFRPTFQVSGTLSNSEIATGAVSSEKSQADNYWYAATAGSSTAYTVDLGAGLRPDSLADGVILRVKLHTACGNDPTLNPTGSSGSALGAKKWRKPGDIVVSANDYANNQILEFTYNSSYNSSAGAWVVQSVAAVPPPAVVADARNLIVTPNSGAPTTQVDVDADVVMLIDSTTDVNYHRPYLAISVNLTIDTGAANGANALDAGSLGTGWYYVYVIFNPTSGTTAGLMSTNASAPTMPSGYTYKALVSAIYSDTAAIRDFHQHGREIWISSDVTASNDADAGGTLFFHNKPGPGNTWTLISTVATPTRAINTIIPPNAKRVFLLAGGVTASTGAANMDERTFIAFAGTDDGVGYSATVLQNSTAQSTDNFAAAVPFIVPIVTTQDFYWRATAAENFRVNVTGYSI